LKHKNKSQDRKRDQPKTTIERLIKKHKDKKKMSFLFGKVQPSTGAMVYLHAVQPGGCATVGNPPEASFNQLTDATHGPDLQKVYFFDDKSPLGSGSGTAIAYSSESSGWGWYIIGEHDACFGVVFWSPSTFVFEVDGSESTVRYPDTCFVSEESFGSASEYACQGGSVVRGVVDSSLCNWNESNELECSCIPKYADPGCQSLLGEFPGTVSFVPPPVLQPNPSPSPSSTSGASQISQLPPHPTLAASPVEQATNRNNGRFSAAFPGPQHGGWLGLVLTVVLGWGW
jgi:hypothetical protein